MPGHPPGDADAPRTPRLAPVHVQSPSQMGTKQIAQTGAGGRASRRPCDVLQVLVLAAKGLRDTAVLEAHLQSTIQVLPYTLTSF